MPAPTISMENPRLHNHRCQGNPTSSETLTKCRLWCPHTILIACKASLRPTLPAPCKSGFGSCEKTIGGLNVAGGAYGKLFSVAFLAGAAGCSRVACSGEMNFGSSFQNEKRSFFEQHCITIETFKASRASKQQRKQRLRCCHAEQSD
jgi:hypothetical protein